ncbi:hypothetical protein VNO78_09000 [Psophocarpus tetragonolobus]|uniref:Uncharacterized protein n=1 Tax=Psophocarpus tetragonolobus TaxID=3891 RepID=A0AAN9XU62_PSOTE
MQTVSLPTLSFRDSSDEASGKFQHDFFAKLKFNEDNIENDENRHEDEVEEHDEEEEEEEFSFVLTNSDGSPISADDAFDNGKIRPVFPIFNQDLLFSNDYDGGAGVRPPIQVFVQHPDESPSSSAAEPPPPEGTYCEWNPKTAKSNSTGFSKLWRFRDVKLRSNSDGKDAFVFLNHAPTAKATEKERNVVIKKVEAKKGKTASSAHEKHYVMSRAKRESDKHKSYLPYRQDLFGFFTNAHGLSRNVHPY